MDEQIKQERVNAAKKEEKPKKEVEKGLDKLKPQREGVGKYINAKLL